MQNCDNNRMDKYTLPYSAKYKTETGQQPLCAQILRAILKASKYFNRRKSQVYGTFHKPSSLMYGARYKQHKLTKSSGMYYTSIYDKTVLPNPKASLIWNLIIVPIFWRLVCCTTCSSCKIKYLLSDSHKSYLRAMSIYRIFYNCERVVRGDYTCQFISTSASSIWTTPPICGP